MEAVTTLLGALVVFTVGFLKLDWQFLGDFAILIVSLCGGIVLAVMSQTKVIWVAYGGIRLTRFLQGAPILRK